MDEPTPLTSILDQKCLRDLSFVLRLWQVRSEGKLVWRASLDSSRPGERHGFAGLDGLFAFIKEIVTAQA